jgi:hypothetical protein
MNKLWEGTFMILTVQEVKQMILLLIFKIAQNLG